MPLSGKNNKNHSKDKVQSDKVQSDKVQGDKVQGTPSSARLSTNWSARQSDKVQGCCASHVFNVFAHCQDAKALKET